MNSNRITSISTTFNLVISSFFFRLKVGSNLIGKEFDLSGRKISLIFLLKNERHHFLKLICNPVSIVRYFEFPFVFNAIDWKVAKSCLDISSPRLFLLYLIEKNPHLKLEVLNPDINDLNETAVHFKVLGLSSQVNLVSYNATQLPYPNNSFDVITSISVIEDIPNNGDSLVIKEIWRVLKPGGKLVITVPCAKTYYEDWRNTDVYGLGNPKKENKFFFQRFYDSATIQSRLCDAIGINPVVIEVFGEKQKGTFTNYEKRWVQFGLKETIKDSWHITKDYQKFPQIDALPGIGVCGLVFEK